MKSIIVFPWQHSTVLYRWQLAFRQHHKWTLLHFHSNNVHMSASQCYVVRTLPVSSPMPI